MVYISTYSFDEPFSTEISVNKKGYDVTNEIGTAKENQQFTSLN